MADHLKQHQWQPGQSGNPAGRPKKTPFADALRDVAAETGAHRAIAIKVIRKASEGDIHFIRLLYERTEGKPIQQHEVAVERETASEYIARIIQETETDGGPVQDGADVAGPGPVQRNLARPAGVLGKTKGNLRRNKGRKKNDPGSKRK